MEFINKEGEKKPFSEISGKPFGLYFSAHWVGAFNPQMFMMHDSLHSRGFKMPAVVLFYWVVHTALRTMHIYRTN